MKKLKELLTPQQLKMFKSYLFEDEFNAYLLDNESEVLAKQSAIENVNYWINATLEQYQSFWDSRYASVSYLLNGEDYDYKEEVIALLLCKQKTSVSKMDILNILDKKYHQHIEYFYMSAFIFFTENDSLKNFVEILFQQIDLAQSTVHKMNT